MTIDNKIMKKSILESYKDKTFRENDKNIEKYEKIIENSTKYVLATFGGAMSLGFGLFFYDFAKESHPIMDSVGAGLATTSPLVSLFIKKVIVDKTQDKIEKSAQEMYKIMKENYIRNQFVSDLKKNGITQQSAENQYQNLSNVNLAVLNDEFEYAMSQYNIATRKGFDYRDFVRENERTQARITAEKNEKRELIQNRLYGGFNMNYTFTDDGIGNDETEDTINLTEEMENLDLQVESENIDLQMEGELC